ncbi:MAG TPA: ATP-binding protein, partial [Kofleriaceae bacterium]
MVSGLAAAIGAVRLHAEAALLRRLNAGAGFADPRIASQIYLRDDAALARLAGGTLRPQGSHRKAATQLAEAIAALPGGGGDPPGRLAVMTERLGVDPAASGVLLVAVAYALDLDTRELCHALAPRRSPALYLETCADVLDADPAALIRAVAPGAALRRGRAIAIEGDGLAAALEVPGPALAWLCGDDALQPPLAGLVELIAAGAELGVVLPPAAVAALDALLPHLGGAAPLAVVVRGPRGSGRRAAAHRLARALGRPLAVIPIPALIALENRTRSPLLGQALAAARLRAAVPLLGDADALYDERGEVAPEHGDAIGHAPGLLIAASSGRGGHLELRRPQLGVALPRTELADRETAWRAALSAHGAAGEAVELAARYVIGPGAISDVVAEAARYAAAAARPVDRDALEASVGRRLSLRLGTYGAVVHRKARFSELVLPDDVIDTLRDMIAMVRERAQILERWGYQRHLGISRGVAGLYSGEPGTGKTMAASVVASELGLELVRIDLSAVVSKYVGETEKNLGKIFDEAQDAHAMLLFDEADSLFGKRTELKTAQDRFANLEVNYILQRMETFDGVSVLTTNAESAIDPALQRRLNFRIRFPEPEVDEREQLWRQLLPPQAGLHGGVDFHALAERFDMTGGYIKNAVVRAAVIAARAGRDLTAEDLW